MNLLFLDVETQGLSPTEHAIIEIGCVLWSTSHATVLEQWSTLVYAESNDAQAINKIPVGALREVACDRATGLVPPEVRHAHAELVLDTLKRLVSRADHIIAHRAEFDRGFIEAASPMLRDAKPSWICSKFDIEFPLSKPGDSLVQVAVAHGVPVTEAHRALTDCTLLRRIFERCVELGHDVDAMIGKALLPRALYQAVVSYDDREKAKAAGFAWNATARRWEKRMTHDEAIAGGMTRGFEVREVSP